MKPRVEQVLTIDGLDRKLLCLFLGLGALDILPGLGGDVAHVGRAEAHNRSIFIVKLLHPPDILTSDGGQPVGNTRDAQELGTRKVGQGVEDGQVDGVADQVERGYAH
jgi:hypothetical protein